jgi:hypothetical protein
MPSRSPVGLQMLACCVETDMYMSIGDCRSLLCLASKDRRRQPEKQLEPAHEDLLERLTLCLHMRLHCRRASTQHGMHHTEHVRILNAVKAKVPGQATVTSWGLLCRPQDPV